MRRIEPADIDVTVLYAACVEQRADELLQQRLNTARQVVFETAQRYEQLGAALSLFQFRRPEVPAGGATENDLVALYESAMVPQKSAGRWAYDRIRLSAPCGICPYCGQLPVGTLDHYLPKRPGGVLAVIPKNLIPACKACNHIKGNASPANAETQVFHPYFDDFEDAQWLGAGIEYSDGPSLTFGVKEVPEWSTVKQARAHNHFRLFGLARLYSTQAANELSGLKYRLLKVYQSRGADGVQRDLGDTAQSWARVLLNSWQTAMYSCLASDETFCDGGFSTI